MATIVAVGALRVKHGTRLTASQIEAGAGPLPLLAKHANIPSLGGREGVTGRGTGWRRL